MEAVRPSRGRDLAQGLQFGDGFDVELEDAGFKRRPHLIPRLADAGEHDPVRWDAAGQRPAHLALGHDVGSGAELCQRADHREVGVGLQRVADAGICPGEGVGEGAVVRLERR